jgi:hypothetical protein
LNVNTLGSHGINQSDDFYDAAPLEPHLLYQGEVLVDVPILVSPKPARWQLLRTRDGNPLDDVMERVGNIGSQVRVLDSNQSAEKWYGPTDGDYVAARLNKRPVLVLSQTCDVQTKDHIQIAPIFPLPAEDVERVKRGDLYSAFYVKDHPPDIVREGFADLEQMQVIHKSYIKRPFPKIHFRLKDVQVRRLQYFLTRYFGRPNSFDVGNDVCPRTGTYLCAACFYMDGRVTAMEREEGQPFENCPTCDGVNWILRGR